MQDPWITTFSGKHFHLLNPSPNDVCIEDIAQALSKQTRFNGHCSQFYSIAQHSVSVMAIAPAPLKLAALLHDAAEAYIGDIVAPLKDILTMIRPIERRIEDAIVMHFNIQHWGDPTIHSIDKSIVVNEAEFLGMDTSEWDPRYKKFRDVQISEALAPSEAYDLFMSSYKSLTE